MHHTSYKLFILPQNCLHMRFKILSLVVVSCILTSQLFAQKIDITFQKQWVEIDTLISTKNLNKQALEKVNILYAIAKQQHKDVQIIKCLIYRVGLEDKVFDNKPNNALFILQKEITETTNEAAKSILYSLLANRYWQYYNTNRWQLYNRSKTIGFKKEAIETWSADDFGNAISGNFKRSIISVAILQATKLQPFNAILLKGNATYLRPTLFDVLAHEALDYFKSGDYYLTKPTYAFELKNLAALQPTDIFLNMPIETIDTASHLYVSLQLFKQLLQFHKNDIDKNALVDVDLERIEWVNNNLVNEQKEELYQTTLETIAKTAAARASQANYLLAQLYVSKAETYQPFGDTTQRYSKVKALQIIEAALARFKQTDEGTSNLKNLRNQILQKIITVETEKVNIPNKPFRALVSYNNVDTLFIRVIKLSDKEMSNQFSDKLDFTDLAKMKAYAFFTQPLPQTNDYQTHSVEIKIAALPVGKYVLLTSSGADFIDTVRKMTKQILYISNISYIKNGNDYFVLHRETGEPLNNVSITIKKQEWNNTKRQDETKLVTEKKSDKNGYFNFTPKDDNGNYDFSFSLKNDQLLLSDNEYIYNQRSDDEDYDKDEAADYEADKAKVFFFIDRRIYRPGQTMYFKGIAITKDFTTKQNKVLAGKDSVLIYLQDANNKNIDSLYFKTNDYGSFSGKFILPQNVLTGQFTIDADNFSNSSSNFSVEEYKRPKFYVEFEKVKGSYRLNDSVTVIGVAKAYAGNAIDGAKVAFNVQRNARFVYDWLWRGKSRPNSRTQQISNGQITTDATGKFSITFKALADDKIDKNTEPVFDFAISADVTDINGETRSATSQVTVGYKSLILHVTVPKLVEADSLKQLAVTTKNLSNENEAADVTIKIYSVQTPQRLIRQRLWQRADMFVMNKETYLQNFPTDEYNDELNEKNWPVSNLVAEGQINTATNTTFQIINKLTVGYYKVEATTTDKYGNEIKDIQFMTLFSRQAIPYPQYNFNYTLNNYVEPNETARFIAGSMAEKTFVIRKTEKPKLVDKERVAYSFTSYNKGLHNITYTADETDRGNVAINEVFVSNNRVYTNLYNIFVPFSNKALQVKYATFRNKTEPGSKETWTVNITGNKGEKVAAELLTSMYDASLDQFQKHAWAKPNILNIIYAKNQFISRAGFGISQSDGNYKNERNIEVVAIKYDQLLIPSLLGNVVSLSRSLQGRMAGVHLLSTNNLEENVVVVGYGTKKRDLTGALSILTESYDKVYTTVEYTDPITGESFQNGRKVLTIKKSLLGETIKIQPRKNFNETAFFFPNLYADTSGNYTFSFTIPEALTQWKWQSLAHTKDLAFGSNTATITTQKTLMVQSNAPRFIREGDNMEFVTKISNLSDKELTGQVSLQLVDAITNTSVDGWFQNVFPTQYFTVAAGQSSAVKFPMQIPFSFNKPLTWRVIATAGNFSDGEENTLPVLSNRAFVTESLPLLIKGDTTQVFVFDKLVNNKSETLTNQSLTVDYTANPIWTAIQALPYLMEYPYECAEQTFNRLYANALAGYITNKQPRLKAIFDLWQQDTTAFKSTLSKNEELKQILLQETPWVLQAESETQQQKNMAMLFDVIKMGEQSNTAIEKLQQMQLVSGGFAWFKGGKEDRYITNYIVTGIGKLTKMNALSTDIAIKLLPIITKALVYLDDAFADDYAQLLKSKAAITKNQLSTTQIQYLYMRSFYTTAIKNKTAYNYYYNQAKQYWVKQNLYHQALLGIVFSRNNETAFTIKNILPSITDNAIISNKGMYWKDTYTTFWYQSNVAFESAMIGFMTEINDQKKDLVIAKNIADCKTWLLLNKQTNNWQTTVATADACYALLANTDSLHADKQVSIKLGNYTIKPQPSQTGTGYFKTTIEGSKITPEMGNVTITTKSQNQLIANSDISYGSIYWQYFEDFDKITASASPLSITKKLFIEKNSNAGKILTPVNDNDEVNIGDKIIIRLELRTDRDMDYVHLKDTRAATMEPVNVLSSYKYQDGLGYYEATKDASTNFFFGNIRKGTYIFEYPVFITHSGTFSIGIANLQSMYAPEFTSHSEGMKIRAK